MPRTMKDENQPDPSATSDAPLSDPDMDMGRIRKRIMLAGFLVLLGFGYWLRGWYTDYKWSLELALVLVAGLYFVWLATWTRWKEPKS